MSSDNDKTVFRKNPGGQGGGSGSGNQPPGGGDRTVLKPTPGRRGTQTQMPRQPEAPAYSSSPQPAARQQPAYPAYSNPASTQFSSEYGLNPIVNAAAMLLAAYQKIRQTVAHPNAGGLHQQLSNGIRKFEETANRKAIASESILAARYLLCAALDEAVLHTPWGAECGWSSRTLLSVFHNETHGGEKFFLLLDRLKERPTQNLDLLELIYILISLGFEGKYQLATRGRDALDRIREDLFQTIRTYRGEHERALSPNWQGLGRTRNTLASYVPMWVVAAVLAGVLMLTYSGFRYWMYRSTAHVAEQLDEIAATGSSKKPMSKDYRK